MPQWGEPLTPAVAVALQLALAMGAPLLAGARGSLRPVGLVLAAVALLTPFLASPDAPLLRTVLSLYSLLGLIRAVDVARGDRHVAAWRRALLGITYFDARETEHGAPGLQRDELPRLLGFGALAVAGYFVAFWPDGGVLARWGGGLVLMYAMVDGVHSLLRVVWRGAGFKVPRFHRDPILSRTITEFWAAAGTS